MQPFADRLRIQFEPPNACSDGDGERQTEAAEEMMAMVRKDPFLALVLEVVGGFFGFPGIGWVYAGRVRWGLVFLVGYWLLDWALGLALSILTLGLWCTVWPAQNLIVGAISGFAVYRWLEKPRP